MGKVILMTGPPATGKSTLCQKLQTRVSNLKHIDYGLLLLKETTKDLTCLTYEELRYRSSELISPHDVRDVDAKVLAIVGELRKEVNSQIVIDTHDVTREFFGFRLTPFSQKCIVEINPDAIISLHCPPEVILERLESDAAGRRELSINAALKHSQLQDGIASIYAVMCGCPLYYVDSNCPRDELCECIINLLALV